MKKVGKYLLSGFILICIVGIFFILAVHIRITEDKRTKIIIAVMQDNQVQDYNSNYYTTWLEEKTGYDIVFEYIHASYDKEYMRALLSAEQGTVDAVFFPKNQNVLSLEEFEDYSVKGYLEDINIFVGEKSNFKKIINEYQKYHLEEKITSKDGKMYYFPQLNTAKKECNFQVLWMNVEWLKKLEIEIPRTTKEFRKVLLAFKEKDPNGNGLNDEIPLIGCEDEPEFRSYNYILSAFTYNNLKGLLYLKRLYSDGLMTEESFVLNKKQVQEMVNSPENIVGAFTSQSIADIVYANSPDVIARYIHVPPLLGENGQQNAIYLEPEPKMGGIIPSNSVHKEEAFALMDLMLSKEASLIAEYGQEGVDWRFSDNRDLSVYNTKAEITTVNYLSDKVQNHNFNGAGPHIVSDKYLNGVTWNGNSSDVEYIDIRAVMSYSPYYRENLSGCSESWKWYNKTLMGEVKGALK